MRYILKITIIIVFLLFNGQAFSATTQTPLAEQLGWQTQPSDKSLCHGFYTEPVLLSSNQSIQPLKERLSQGKNAKNASELVGQDTVKLQGLSAWGQAKKIIQTKPSYLQFNQASYTTCPPTENGWKLSADQIILDKEKGRGMAHHVTLMI